MKIHQMNRMIMAVVGMMALSGPALAASPSHKNLCSGITSNDSGTLANGALEMNWSLTNIKIKAGGIETDFQVSAIKGRLGETDMTIDAESNDGSTIHFIMPLDGMQTRRQPDTMHARFIDGTDFIGVCTPITGRL